ncbi:secretion related GTPase SrgD [Aspergillus lentulus]|uniref:Secretion related GTPase SrgD n=2 Tax=Aspergillus lentulus TaxID=293939 RepID=A0ABQ1APL3_ASPLE|nr:secretion related GTPase SrgD [Aspergillus lentulus]GFF43649.1 secretion related GTPase SrgD [Aspergillus lentulus]GFF67562.1 secretion related GTPase SrgD [Aspergillus lentulus]GFF85735.1 secretion related GTPase SrgD [Aspergillus lentulus]GFG13705.1 secretion related GTPase SrgD [Aspergillus lentulus]
MLRTFWMQSRIDPVYLLIEASRTRNLAYRCGSLAGGIGNIIYTPDPTFFVSMSQPWDYIAKLVCIGDSGTGKSSLTIRLCEGRFSSSHDVTIGVEFGSRIVPVGPPASKSLGVDSDASDSSALPSSTATAMVASHESVSSGLPSPPRKPLGDQPQKKMKLSLWDTAGQETYKSITRSYFRGASGALLVFDITRPSTFTSCTQWLQDLRQIAEDGIVVILVGNKSDLAEVKSDVNQRRVTRQEAEEWCRMNNVVRYVETSAKSGEGVERAFLEVAERIYRNIEAGKYDLNDRRSGVKGFGATGGASAGTPKTITLGLNDAMRSGGNSWRGACC